MKPQRSLLGTFHPSFHVPPYGAHAWAWFAIKCLKTSQVIAEIDAYIACPFSGRCEFDNCRWNDVWYDWNWYDEEHMPELTVMGGPGFMFVQCFSETPVFYDPNQLPLPF